ncbi:hypothetical protein B0T25DRAFT_553259 [Lasiosphaeria hispida]|uniref:Uncharacterized protein n=1 Tax=Lasiosphaeria hispida TaxID=260671 RepID=A0AAJ0HCY5_9PEZI|nr:hypothetical protein B0T25DRAFT_553259 [Lasiosphaeria hispida]
MIYSPQMSSTNAAGVETGGGVDDRGSGPNARPASVNFTLWIETVEYKVLAQWPSSAPSDSPLEVMHQGIKIVLHRPDEVSEDRVITVRVTELQYAQMVLLDFGRLSWPHPSYATLRPEVVVVPKDHEAWEERLRRESG